MNRLMLTNILMEIIKKDLSIDEMSFEVFRDIVDKTPYEEYDENKNAYVETILIYTIFSKIPYYKVLWILEKLGEKIVKISQGYDRYNGLSKIITYGCLAEMMPNIKRRVEAETMLHILDLSYTYFMHGKLDKTKTINKLQKEMSNKEILTGFNVAENYLYNQNTLFENKAESDLKDIIPKNNTRIDLKDSISKNNTNYKEHISNQLRQSIKNNYNLEKFESFIKEIYSIIEDSDIEDVNLLLITFSETIDKLYNHVIKTWHDNSNNIKEESLPLLSLIK